MHLSGMALPCEYASIPVYDNVYYDIGDNQSIQDDLSTFSAHIQNLARISNEATNKSLVILDELGSGTDPVEGQAIASAVLDYFRKKNIYTMATTHYAKLKAYGQQYEDIMLSSVEFDQVDLKPTYRYLENTIGQSNALEIASRYGLNRTILEAAREFKLAQQTPEDRVMENLQKQLTTAQEEVKKPFAQEAELAEKTARLAELNSMLNMDERDSSDVLGIDEDTDVDIEAAEKSQQAVSYAGRVSDMASREAERTAERRPSVLDRLHSRQEQVAQAGRKQLPARKQEQSL
jgi:DNA mismatch repair protein MutS2